MAMAKKISELKFNAKAMFYACVLKDLQKIVAKCGYGYQNNSNPSEPLVHKQIVNL